MDLKLKKKRAEHIQPTLYIKHMHFTLVCNVSLKGCKTPVL